MTGLLQRAWAAAQSLVTPAGERVDRAALAAEEGGPTLTGVRSILSEHPAAGITPQRLAALLRTAEEGDATAYLELAEDMEERDAHYRAVVATRKLSVAQLEMTVEAATDGAADQKAADLVRQWLAQTDTEELAFDLLDGLGKGWSAVELIWDTAGQLWLPVDCVHRDPRWFQADRLDGKTLRLRDGSADGVDLTPHKWLIHRPRTKSGLPIRGGLARVAAWAYLFKSIAIKDWVIFAEVYGHPLRLGKYGTGASEHDKGVLLRAVRNLGTDAAAIIPQSMLVEMISSSTSNVDLWQNLCAYMDQQVSKAVLGQTTTTDAVSGGHAVSQEHRLVQEDIERADARQLAATLNRQLVPALVSFNLGPQAAYPKIIIGRPDEEDIDALVDRVVKLVPLGLKVSMSVVRDKLGLPDPAADEELLTAAGGGMPGQTPPGTATAAAGGVKALAATAVGPGPDDIDGLVAAMLDEWQPVMAPVVEPVIAAVQAATSPQELMDKLAALAASDPNALVEMLARGGFTARLAGMTDDA